MKEFQRKGLDEMSKAKSFSEREAMQNARTRKTSVAPTAKADTSDKEDMERTQLSNERARNPGEFDRAKQMYNSAVQKQSEDNRPAVATPPMSAKPAGPIGNTTTYNAADKTYTTAPAKPMGMKKGGMCSGGKATKMAKGGSASSRGDGIAQRGKTRGKFC